tara:strand:- start:485 stop:1825 length:1341 start_codon:yes stop_codon:yes gene_type:complete
MKVISTIGPASEDLSNLKKILDHSSIVRLNGSHSSLNWHKKVLDKIKKLDPYKTILFDIPGVKPRTLNQSNLEINKNDMVLFFYKKFKFEKKVHKIIEISNPLPKFKSKIKTFSLDDGKYTFKLIEYNSEFIVGKSLNKFTLKTKKGLNIPDGIYDNKKQTLKYLKFLNQIQDFKIDAVGLSYIQDPKTISKIRKKYKKLIIVSKIENLEGLNNAQMICENSDAIMIDRGDLSAEIGLENMYEAIIKISNHSKKFHVPLIMATDNLTSMINHDQPTKSEIVSIEHAKSIGTDCIMLSEETAISNNYLNTLKWLKKAFFKPSIKKNFKDVSILNINKYLNQMQVVLVSKKGYVFEKAIKKFDENLIIYFTNDIFSFHRSVFYKNFKSIYLSKLIREKFDQSYVFKIIKKYKSFVFENSNMVLLIHALFPRKKIRANSISILNKRDFL